MATAEQDFYGSGSRAFIQEKPKPQLLLVESQPQGDLGRTGHLFFDWSRDQYHQSDTVLAARVALLSKPSGVQPRELGKAFLQDKAQIQEAADRANRANSHLPHTTPEDVKSKADKIFPFAQRMTVLGTEQLQGIIASYPEVIDHEKHLSEEDLRRRANLMILEASQDKNLGHKESELRKDEPSVVFTYKRPVEAPKVEEKVLVGV